MPAHLTNIISLTHRHTPFTHPWQTFLFYPATLLNNRPPIPLQPQTDPATHANPGTKPPTHCPDAAFPYWMRGGGEFPHPSAGWLFLPCSQTWINESQQKGWWRRGHSCILEPSTVEAQRGSGILFVCLRWREYEGSERDWQGLIRSNILTHTHSLSEKQAVVKDNVTTAG